MPDVDGTIGRDSHENPEQCIIGRLLRRDQTALEDLLRDYGPFLNHYLYTRFKENLNVQDREDVIAKVLFRTWRYTGNSENQTRIQRRRFSLTSWLRILARNAAIDLLRSRQRRPALPLSAATFRNQLSGNTARDDEAAPAEAAVLRDLRRLLSRLSRTERLIVLSAAMPTGQSLGPRVAEELGLTRENYRKRKSRLIQRLRKELRALGHGEDE